MIKFDILTVSADARHLLVGASVLDIPWFKDVHITRIWVDTQDTFEDKRPSSKAWEFVVEEENAKEVFERFSLNDIDPSGNFFKDPRKNLFFVYIECDGVPDANTPCGFDKKYTLGTAYNTCLIREQLMYYVKQTASSCKIPKEFINLFLRSKALEVSLCQGHYPEAIRFWEDFIENPRLWRDNPDLFRNLLDGFTLKDTVNKNCGCHG